MARRTTGDIYPEFSAFINEFYDLGIHIHISVPCVFENIFSTWEN